MSKRGSRTASRYQRACHECRTRKRRCHDFDGVACEPCRLNNRACSLSEPDEYLPAPTAMDGKKQRSASEDDDLPDSSEPGFQGLGLGLGLAEVVLPAPAPSAPLAAATSYTLTDTARLTGLAMRSGSPHLVMVPEVLAEAQLLADNDATRQTPSGVAARAVVHAAVALGAFTLCEPELVACICDNLLQAEALLQTDASALSQTPLTFHAHLLLAQVGNWGTSEESNDFARRHVARTMMAGAAAAEGAGEVGEGLTWLVQWGLTSNDAGPELNHSLQQLGGGSGLLRVIKTYHVCIEHSRLVQSRTLQLVEPLPSTELLTMLLDACDVEVGFSQWARCLRHALTALVAAALGDMEKAVTRTTQVLRLVESDWKVLGAQAVRRTVAALLTYWQRAGVPAELVDGVARVWQWTAEAASRADSITRRVWGVGGVVNPPSSLMVEPLPPFDAEAVFGGSASASAGGRNAGQRPPLPPAAAGATADDYSAAAAAAASGGLSKEEAEWLGDVLSL